MHHNGAYTVPGKCESFPNANGLQILVRCRRLSKEGSVKGRDGAYTAIDTSQTLYKYTLD